MNGFEPIDQVSPPAEEAPPEQYPFWGYLDIAFFTAFALPSLIVAGVLVKAASLVTSWNPPGKAPEILAAQFLGYGIWFTFLYWLLRLRYRRPFWRSLGWIRPAEGFPKSALWGLLLAAGVVVAGALLKTPDLDLPIKELLRDRVSILLVAAFAVTLGPVCEELLFRGFLLPLLVRSLGAVPAVFAAALPFALLHGPQYAWSWRHVLLITLAGAAFGWMRHKSGSTAAATAMHAAYNLALFAGFLIQGKDLGSV